MSGAYGLDGHAIVVTGGARGIGAGIAQVLAEGGATAVIADIDGAAAAEQAEALRAADHGDDATTRWRGTEEYR